MKQDSHSNLHHHIMGSNNLICFVVIFVVVLFTERCLSRKPTRPCLRFWQQRHITPTFLLRNTPGALEQCILYFAEEKTLLVVAY